MIAGGTVANFTNPMIFRSNPAASQPRSQMKATARQIHSSSLLEDCSFLEGDRVQYGLLQDSPGWLIMVG
jgi:hypothetical protein